METLLSFALWIGAIGLMMLICGRHMLGHGRGGHAHRSDSAAPGGQNLRWVAPKKAVDLVCGKTVSPEDARPSVFDGDVRYFCSRECREAFEAAPHLYMGGRRPGGDRRLERSHV